jgi:hypothetical protein
VSNDRVFSLPERNQQPSDSENAVIYPPLEEQRESEIPEPKHRVRFAPVIHEGLMYGFAVKCANDAAELKRMLAGVIGVRATAGCVIDGFCICFWRFVYPRAADDVRWLELRGIISEVADLSRSDLEFVDWDPTNEVLDLLDGNGKQIDLDKCLQDLNEKLAPLRRSEEVAAARATDDASSRRDDKERAETISEGYTRIPNDVLDDASLTVGARFTYALLLRHSYGKNFCFPSQKRLAGLMGGISERWLRTYIRELEAAGLLKTERKDRTRHNRYCLQRLVENDRNHTSRQDR